MLNTDSQRSIDRTEFCKKFGMLQSYILLKFNGNSNRKKYISCTGDDYNYGIR